MARGAIVLVHGGLYEDMDADRFWIEPAVATALTEAGFVVHAPDRPASPGSWADESDALASHLERSGLQDVPVVAGSNGCSVAVRLAVDHLNLVSRLVLCWPATAGDEHVDGNARQAIGHRAGAAVADRLLAGETLRGVSDAELREITVPVGIIPTELEDPIHSHTTVHRLRTLIPSAQVTKGFPESPHPNFGDVRGEFVRTLMGLLAP